MEFKKESSNPTGFDIHCHVEELLPSMVSSLSYFIFVHLPNEIKLTTKHLEYIGECTRWAHMNFGSISMSGKHDPFLFQRLLFHTNAIENKWKSNNGRKLNQDEMYAELAGYMKDGFKITKDCAEFKYFSTIYEFVSYTSFPT